MSSKGPRVGSLWVSRLRVTETVTASADTYRRRSAVAPPKRSPPNAKVSTRAR